MIIRENAISPVIGVILMVAITVILTAVIASFVFGTMGNFDKTILISIDADRINQSHIKLVNFGGKDHSLLITGSTFNVTINGKPVDSVNPSQNLQNTIGSIAYYDISGHTIGMGLDDIQVTAILTEGHKSIVYSSKI
jgi:flagellin-like protein